MVVQDLITNAIKKLAVVAAGENPTASELADGLSSLQSMLRSWSALRGLIFASTKDSFSLVAGTSLYTWGTGGTFNSERPNQVLGAEIVDSAGISHSVDIISEGEYRRIAVKTTSSRPYALFLHPLYPLASVYLYPVPSEVETLKTDSLKPFTETSSFSALADTLAFPLHYEEALTYNLAVRYASNFGKVVPAEVIAIANNTYDRILNLNVAQQVEPVGMSLPIGSSGGLYSINSDTYR